MEGVDRAESREEDDGIKDELRLGQVPAGARQAPGAHADPHDDAEQAPLLVDLSRFGIANENEIFVATEEPYGLIEATVIQERRRF
jgi:hypothetical protein